MAMKRKPTPAWINPHKKHMPKGPWTQCEFSPSGKKLIFAGFFINMEMTMAIGTGTGICLNWIPSMQMARKAHSRVPGNIQKEKCNLWGSLGPSVALESQA